MRKNEMIYRVLFSLVFCTCLAATPTSDAVLAWVREPRIKSEIYNIRIVVFKEDHMNLVEIVQEWKGQKTYSITYSWRRLGDSETIERPISLVPGARKGLRAVRALVHFLKSAKHPFLPSTAIVLHAPGLLLSSQSVSGENIFEGLLYEFKDLGILLDRIEADNTPPKL